MISFIGITSLPLLLLSIIFIFFHAKFIRLHNANKINHSLLHELLIHKLELLQFFEQDVHESRVVFSADDDLLDKIADLEERLCDFNFSDEDNEELSSITREIEDVQIMYNQSKEELNKFTDGFPGKFLATFLIGKSRRQ